MEDGKEEMRGNTGSQSRGKTGIKREKAGERIKK